MSEPESAGRPIAHPAAGSGSPDADEFLSYYGLQTSPFRGSAAAGRLWLGKTQQALLATLTAAIGRSRGIVLLTGDVGTGKSSLAKALIDRLGDEGLLIGIVSNLGLEPSELFEAVADAYGIREECHTRAAFVHGLQDLLERTGSSYKKALLIIDEAQSLSDEILREIQEISAIRATEGHPLVILLVGQTELNVTLSEERHAALRQRITDECRVAPLTEDEVGEYIRYCLEDAGSKHPIFTPDAIRDIASISRGAPGVINVICDRALRARSREARTVDRGIIEGYLGQIGSPNPLPEAEEHNLPRLTPIDRPASGTVPQRNGRAREGLTRNTGVRSAILLAAALLTTAGYFLYAGWLTSTQHTPAQERSRDTAVEKGAPKAVTDSTPPFATGAPGVARENASLPEAPRAPQPPRVKDVPRVEERNVPRTVDTPAPKNAPSDKKAESSDPGAIIDWLLSGSAPGTR